MEDYAANSHLSKRNNAAATEDSVPEKKVTKTISGNVKLKKKSGWSKFANSIFQTDAGNIADYVVTDVLLPALKKFIDDAVTEGIRLLLYGDTGSRKKTTGSVFAYDKVSSIRTNNRPAIRTSSYDYDDIIYESRGEAEEVLSILLEILDRYKVVTINDYYDASNVTTNNYTYQKYGWTDLSTAVITRVREGFVIKFPRALPID